MITAELVRPEALRPSDLQAWAAFRAAEPAFANPLFGPAWAQAVGRVRRDACVSVLKRDGVTLGFLPHHRTGHGPARPIGAPFSDLHALIADPGRSFTLAEAVEAAGLRGFRYSGLVDPGGRASGVVARALAHVVVQTGSDDLTAVIRDRNPKRFKNWRRLSAKLEREHRGTDLTPIRNSPQSLALLLDWKRAQLRRSGLHDVYRPPWVQQLMGGLLANQTSEFGGLLVSLSVGDRMIAGEFGLIEDGCFHPWVAAYDPAFAPYSPGNLLQLKIIEEMRPLGLRRYDLGSGSDHYKAPMATGAVEVLTGVTYSPGRRPSPLDGALSRSRLGARASQRWEQIASVEPTALGRLQGLMTAVRDGPKRVSAGQTAAAS